MATNKSKALALAKIGMHVFPCKDSGAPHLEHGFLEASNDPKDIDQWWVEHPQALVGVACGMSGLVVLDLDLKFDNEGTATVDGMQQLEDNWLDIPETYTYTSKGGFGNHYVYTAPEGLNLGPAVKYRQMAGVDRRAGGSYVVWAGDVPEDRSVFSTNLPQWFLDENNVRSADAFEGTLRDWFVNLVPGDPNKRVQKAIDAIPADPSHEQMVKAQVHAIRLGAEGNPGVPQLLEALEAAFLNRPAENHGTPESRWESDFARALEGGIKKYGATIELMSVLPEYTIGMVPPSVPDRLLSGPNGDKDTFNQLMNSLVRSVDDDLTALSILWNAPSVKDLSREWGIEFVHARLTEARVKPAPEVENPSLDDPGVATDFVPLLDDIERETVRSHPTFIDEYLDATHDYKGWHNENYATISAWTLLSMAFGRRAFIPQGPNPGMNLWFMALGESGTGKSSENEFLKTCLDLMLKDGETYYNLGANSSPEALHLALLERDGKPSIIHHDEASDFFENIRRKDWMATLKDLLSKWYMGVVDPMQKIGLKEMRGKSAVTSFNIQMLATPGRLLGLIDTDMFETGFLARFNWVWAPPSDDPEAKYRVSRSKASEDGAPAHCYQLVADLIMATRWLPPKPVQMNWEPAVEQRFIRAHRDMDRIAKTRERYTTTEPAVTRLGKETLWKCASLLALYRGEKVIRAVDALVALSYVEQWFNTLFQVVSAAGEGDFNKDCNDISAYVASNPKGVTEAQVYHRFRSMIVRNSKELDDRLDFLLKSGQIVRKTVEGKGDKSVYVINGSK